MGACYENSYFIPTKNKNISQKKQKSGPIVVQQATPLNKIFIMKFMSSKMEGFVKL